MATPMEFEKVIVETENRIRELRKLSQESDVNFSSEIRMLEKRIQKQLGEIYSELSPWQIVQVARHPDRPVLKDYISLMCQEFIELHGDRRQQRENPRGKHPKKFWHGQSWRIPEGPQVDENGGEI